MVLESVPFSVYCVIHNLVHEIPNSQPTELRLHSFILGFSEGATSTLHRSLIAGATLVAVILLGWLMDTPSVSRM